MENSWIARLAPLARPPLRWRRPEARPPRQLGASRRVVLVLALLSLVVAPLPASSRRGAERLPDPMAPELTLTERLNALVERHKLELQALETLEAEFVQEKVSSFLVEPERAHGVFSYRAPDAVRWEYAKPNPIVVLIHGEELLTWYRDLGRAERLRVQRYSDQAFKYLGASGSLETLKEYFTIQVDFPSRAGEPYRLDLSPQYPRIEKRLKSMVLWISGDTFLPYRLKYVEPNGDHTEYFFTNVRINGEIPSERFQLSLPPEVEIDVLEVGR